MLLKREWCAIILFFSILVACIVIGYLSQDFVDPTIACAISQK